MTDDRDERRLHRGDLTVPVWRWYSTRFVILVACGTALIFVSTVGVAAFLLGGDRFGAIGDVLGVIGLIVALPLIMVWGKFCYQRFD